MSNAQRPDDELEARWAARVATLGAEPMGDEIRRVWDNAVPQGSTQRADLSVPASIRSAPVIEELLAHLGAAKMQMLPTDDRIIADHIIAAHALALVLFRSAQA